MTFKNLPEFCSSGSCHQNTGTESQPEFMSIWGGVCYLDSFPWICLSSWACLSVTQGSHLGLASCTPHPGADGTGLCKLEGFGSLKEHRALVVSQSL